MSESAPRLVSIDHCPSPAHRAVAGLIGCALGWPVTRRLLDDLRHAAPAEIARIAQLHHVHTVMADGFRMAPDARALVPDDLQIFFAEMKRANAERNAVLRAQIAQIGAAMEAKGIQVIVLKGGAELLAPTYPDAAQRFLSDTDLLVRDAQIDDAVAVLDELGGQPDPDEGRPTHHLPAITIDPALGPIELHHRLGDGITDRILSPDRMFEAAIRHDASVWIPSDTMRMVHMIVHAQFHHHQYALSTLNLRDCADLVAMRRAFPAQVFENAAGHFRDAGQSGAFDALVAVTGAFFPVEERSRPSSAAERWAKRAIDLYGRPDAQRRRENLGWVLLCCWRLIMSPGFRRYYLGLILHRGRIAQKIGALFSRSRKLR